MVNKISSKLADDDDDGHDANIPNIQLMMTPATNVNEIPMAAYHKYEML